MRKGFTLVELLVVLVIVGLLIAVIIPNTLRAIYQARSKNCAANIRSIDAACQMYYSENGTWPTALTQLQPYFPDDDGDSQGDLPTCPFGVAYSLTGDSTNGYRCDRTGHFSAGNWPERHD